MNDNKIDKVTVQNLDIAMRMCGMIFDHKTIDKIIDLVELLEEKGNQASITDIVELQSAWDNRYTLGKLSKGVENV